MKLRALSAREFSVSSKNRMRKINAKWEEETEKIRSNSPESVVFCCVRRDWTWIRTVRGKTVAAWLECWTADGLVVFHSFRNARWNRATVLCWCSDCENPFDCCEIAHRNRGGFILFLSGVFSYCLVLPSGVRATQIRSSSQGPGTWFCCCRSFVVNFVSPASIVRCDFVGCARKTHFYAQLNNECSAAAEVGPMVARTRTSVSHGQIVCLYSLFLSSIFRLRRWLRMRYRCSPSSTPGHCEDIQPTKITTIITIIISHTTLICLAGFPY